MAAITIDTKYDVGDVLFYVTEGAIKKVVVDQISIYKNIDGQKITYLAAGIDLTESELFATAQTSADKYAARLVSEFVV